MKTKATFAARKTEATHPLGHQASPVQDRLGTVQTAFVIDSSYQTCIPLSALPVETDKEDQMI